MGLEKGLPLKPHKSQKKSMETTWSDTVSPVLSRSFDPIKIKWQLLTDGTRGEGPGKRSGHAMSVVNGGIFLFGGGGVEDNTFLDSLWVYDTAGHRYIILHFSLSPPFLGAVLASAGRGSIECGKRSTHTVRGK